MNVILLDTNIVSFILKADSRALDYEPHLKDQQLAISFMTVAELYQWVAVRNWGERRRNQLTQMLKANYTVLSFDIKLCQIWGEIRASRQAVGKPIPSQDAWVAATALHYRLSLVTHNPRDFSDISNLKLITTVHQTLDEVLADLRAYQAGRQSRQQDLQPRTASGADQR